jgi:hypothetical protein
MPALSYDECPADMRELGRYIVEHGHSPERPLRQHGQACPLPSRGRDGFWRWFMAAVRCRCDCHRRGVVS